MINNCNIIITILKLSFGSNKKKTKYKPTADTEINKIILKNINGNLL